jgi:Secretion system C-terminal sorting domain
MKIKFLFVILFSMNSILTAQVIQNSSDFIRNSNLEGFDEQATINHLRNKGFTDAKLQELLEGEKAKYRNSQRITVSNVTIPSFNKTLTSCSNFGFEQLSFANWNASYATVMNSAWGVCPTPLPPNNYTPGFVLGIDNWYLNTVPDSATNEKEVLLTCSTCYDYNARDPLNGNYMIPYLASNGGLASARLGNAMVGGETERLVYPFFVTPINYQISYMYAIVYQNPTAHALDEQPFFTVNIKDSTGNQIGTNCGAFCYFADPSDTSFTILPANSTYNQNSNAILFKKWTTVALDLSHYIGQTLNLEFTTGDCALSGHFGYAYIDAKCDSWQRNFDFTLGDSIATLVAPPNFLMYQWLDSLNNPIPGETNDTLIVHNPANGSHWPVQIQSCANVGCQSVYDIWLYDPTGISENDLQDSNWEIYPNPATDILGLTYNLVSESNVTIKILSVLGEKVFEKSYTQQLRGKHDISFSLKDVKAGVYAITLEYGGKVSSKKIVLQD